MPRIRSSRTHLRINIVTVNAPGRIAQRQYLSLRKAGRVGRAKLTRRSEIHWRGTAGRDSLLPCVRVPDSVSHLCAPHLPCCSHCSSWRRMEPRFLSFSNAMLQIAAWRAARGRKPAVAVSQATWLTRTVRRGPRHRCALMDAGNFLQHREVSLPALPRSDSTRPRSLRPRRCGGQQTTAPVLPT